MARKKLKWKMVYIEFVLDSHGFDIRLFLIVFPEVARKLYST